MDVYSSILIIGSKGMLARDLAEELRCRGHSFAAVDRAECDVTQADQVEALFDSCKPTLVFNCAAYTAVDLCEDEPTAAFAVNSTAVQWMAQASQKHQSKLVHFSTDFVFDGQNDRPYRPTDSTNPLSVYGSSKLEGEKQVRHLAPASWLIIRTAWLFGRYGNCFPSKIVELARAGKPLRIVNDQWGCPTATTDLTKAATCLVDKNANGIFHVTNTSPVTWYDFTAEILKEFNIPANLSPVSTTEWFQMRPKQAKRPAYSVLDVSDYERTTGQKLRDWRAALREYRQSL